MLRPKFLNRNRQPARHHGKKFPPAFAIWSALGSAICLAWIFSNPRFAFLAWFGLVPLFHGLCIKSRLHRALLLFIFGTTLFLGTIYWLAHVSLGGMLALCIMLGAEFALLGLVVPDPQRSWSLLTIPALWIGLERLRGIIFGGFGWGIIGYTQYLNLPFIQIADRLGVWGVSFIIVLGNLALAQLIRNRKQLQWRTASVCILLPLSCVSGAYAYGFFRLQQHFTGPDITVSVVQGNIPQENKWNTRYVETILEKFSRLSRETAAASPELVVWPETSVPGYLLDEPRLYPAVTGLAQNLKTYLLVGSPREDYFTRSYYNSAFLFGPRGELLQMHDKIHLVPFGEYIPYGNLFWFLKNSPIADFSAGKRHTVFRLRSRDGREIRFGVLICFEDAFPGLVRQFRRNGADFLITITNEAWFRHSDEPMQHVGISVFRAIENRCWFVRCANTGISGFIDPRGRIRNIVECNGERIFIEGTETAFLGHL